MALSDEQIRMACFELTLTGNNPRGTPVERAQQYVKWVAGDEIRLGCLRLASKSHGNLARIGVDRLIIEAQKILDFVSPAPPPAPPPKPASQAESLRRRGRPRKN